MQEPVHVCMKTAAFLTSNTDVLLPGGVLFGVRSQCSEKKMFVILRNILAKLDCDARYADSVCHVFEI